MRTLPICLLVPAALAVAQDSPFSAFNRCAFGQMNIWLPGSAEKMPALRRITALSPPARSAGSARSLDTWPMRSTCLVPLCGEGNPAPENRADQNLESRSGVTVSTVFRGLWLFPFGILVTRSGFFPRILGILWLVAGSSGFSSKEPRRRNDRRSLPMSTDCPPKW